MHPTLPPKHEKIYNFTYVTLFIIEFLLGSFYRRVIHLCQKDNNLQDNILFVAKSYVPRIYPIIYVNYQD